MITKKEFDMQSKSRLSIKIFILLFLVVIYGCTGDQEHKIINKGIALIERQELDQAILEFNKVIQLNPKNAYGYYNRAVVYGLKKQPQEAIADYNKIIEMYPNTAAKSYNNRGFIYYSTYKNFDQAISDYKNAIRVNTKYTLAYMNLGILYTDKGDLDTGLESYAKIIELEPKNIVGYIGRYKVYFKKKDYVHCWQDVHMAESLGHKPAESFLKQLKEASGRQI